MNCTECGKENPDDAQLCYSCSRTLTETFVSTENPNVKVSGLAIASLVLSILGVFTFAITAIPAVILGIISLLRIEKSGGRLTGKGFATVGIAAAVAVFFVIGVSMPALARAREISFRMVCGRNLSGIGKAMLIYSNDYDDEMPRAGGRRSVWTNGIRSWTANNRFLAYGLQANGSGGQASISSCFYLLVKYLEVTPKSFVCHGDTGVTDFTLAEYGVSGRYLIDLWDFGPNPTEHCSYAYHMPFGLYALTMSSEPGMAVAADRNPWIESPVAGAKEISLLTRYQPGGGKEAVNIGNAIAHREDGQNVLFMDSHVGFEKRPFCAINDDNIYTYWDGGDIRRGGLPIPGASEPRDRLDSFLVHDGEGGGVAPPPPPKGRGCFLADTDVWVDGTVVQISKVVQGETVGKLGCAALKASLEQIEKLEEHVGTFECRDIVLESGNRISVVDAHCFMLDSGQWIAAQDLRNGLRLKTLNGTVSIKSVTTRAMPFVGKVYNLKVKSSDQYLVGEDAVIVRDY